MFKKVKINDRIFSYTLKRKKGNKCVRLSVYADGRFVVTAPKWYPIYVVQKFLEEKSSWIFEKLKSVDFALLAQKEKAEKANYKKLKKEAREIIQSRIIEMNKTYGFDYNRIAIRNQKTCWGSASYKKNLNFNYKIAFFPERLRDYIIVHEICHLKELNHSSKFWELVTRTFPDYKEIRKQIKNNQRL